MTAHKTGVLVDLSNPYEADIRLCRDARKLLWSAQDLLYTRRAYWKAGDLIGSVIVVLTRSIEWMEDYDGQ